MVDWIKMNEITYKNTYTQEQRDALWQYFIDHSKIQKNGFYGIMFYIRDENDFYKRLYSRHTGDFKRYDKLEKQHKNEMLYVHITRKKAFKKAERSKGIDMGNNLWEKILLFFYRKLRNYIFE